MRGDEVRGDEGRGGRVGAASEPLHYAFASLAFVAGLFRSPVEPPALRGASLASFRRLPGPLRAPYAALRFASLRSVVSTGRRCFGRVKVVVPDRFQDLVLTFPLNVFVEETIDGSERLAKL